VFQAYLTSFLVEPGYEEPIQNIDQMLKSEMKFGFFYVYNLLFNNPSDPVESAIQKNALQFPSVSDALLWATVYQNISTILTDFDIETYRRKKLWTNENNKPSLCELEDGVIRTFDFAILVRKRSPFFEIINDVIGHIVEGGIFLHIKERGIYKGKLESKFDPSTPYYTYYAISTGHLQTAFYFLMLGYVLSLACFVSEIIWYRFSSKGVNKQAKISRPMIHRHNL
jgi:hypothetical protein